MNNNKFEQASKLKNRIECLASALKELRPSTFCFQTKEEIIYIDDKKINKEIICAVRKILETHLNQAEKEFKKL